MSNKIYLIQKKITAPILGAVYGIHKTAVGHRLRCRVAAQCPGAEMIKIAFDKTWYYTNPLVKVGIFQAPPRRSYRFFEIYFATR